MGFIKVKAVRDESGHWYLIPSDQEKKFSKLQDLACEDNYKAQEEFEFLFSQYRTGGDLNNEQLYIERNY